MLGCPLPLDEHAVSVSLPLWRDVIGYEEGEARVVAAMRIGYPRFKLHAAVEALSQHLLAQIHREVAGTPVGHTPFTWLAQQGNAIGHTNYSWEGDLPDACMVFPSRAVALRFRAFMESGPEPRRVQLRPAGIMDIYAAVFEAGPSARKAKAYWQHTGEIVSSRQAEAALRLLGLDSPSVTRLFCVDGLRHCSSEDRTETGGMAAEALVRDRIASIVQEHPENVLVTVSGMTAIFCALRLARALDRSRGLLGRRVVVFGFPYIDTLKMMERAELNPEGAVFLGDGGAVDLQRLEELVRAGAGVAAVFTEFPSNPLLKCPDMQRLSRLAAEFDFLLVVDDTVANFHNVDLLHSEGVAADVVCSSLTKAFSGSGDVMAGSAVINSRGRHCVELLAMLPSLEAPTLFDADALVLEYNSRDFALRSDRASASALVLARWFVSLGPALVADVYYPGLRDDEDSRRFECVSRSRHGDPAGFGCLISITLAQAVDTQAFYDALELSKGPSLGNSFTLVCPYTMLAHYRELAWAASFGVAPQLIRISVGLEDTETLKTKFMSAFSAGQRLSAHAAL